jgi:hypothetical protein
MMSFVVRRCVERRSAAICCDGLDRPLQVVMLAITAARRHGQKKPGTAGGGGRANSVPAVAEPVAGDLQSRGGAPPLARWRPAAADGRGADFPSRLALAMAPCPGAQRIVGEGEGTIDKYTSRAA